MIESVVKAVNVRDGTGSAAWASAGFIWLELRNDINAAQGFALISIFYYLKDSFGKIHTAAFGCSYTGSCQRSFVNAVKPGNHYFTRNHFQVSGEDVTNIYRHDIVGADDRIRKHVSF